MAANQYYINAYDPCVPIEGYGNQFKSYLDQKFGELDMEEVEQNIIDAVNTSKDEIKVSVEESASSVTENITSAVTANTESANSDLLGKITCLVNNSTQETYCNIYNAKNEIIDSIDKLNTAVTETMAADITSAISTAKDEIITNNNENTEDIKTEIQEVKDQVASGDTGDKEEILNAITSAKTELSDKISAAEANIVNYDNINKDAVVAEITSAKEEEKAALDKMREDLIAQVNSTNSLVQAGFTDLNTAVIANKEDAVSRINNNVNQRAAEIINEINIDDPVEPYDVYGGMVRNILKPNVDSITSDDIAKLSKVTSKSISTVVFSIRVEDVAVTGMNDDATGQLYQDAKVENEMNLVFAYPAEFENTEILDSNGANITQYFSKKLMEIGEVPYIVVMQVSKISNLYDPQWETPMAYTLNYNLKMSR